MHKKIVNNLLNFTAAKAWIYLDLPGYKWYY